MADAPVHRWPRPKVLVLLAEAESAGIARDVAVAVLIDLLTGSDFNLPALNPEPERGRAVAGGYQETSVTED